MNCLAVVNGHIYTGSGDTTIRATSLATGQLADTFKVTPAVWSQHHSRNPRRVRAQAHVHARGFAPGRVCVCLRTRMFVSGACWAGVLARAHRRCALLWLGRLLRPAMERQHACAPLGPPVWSVPCGLPVLVAQCRSGLQQHWCGLPHLPAGTAPVQLRVRLDRLICEHCCSALLYVGACRTARGTVSTEWCGGAAGTCLTVLEGHLDWVNALHVMDGILCA